MQLTWLGHSALSVQTTSGETVLIDPFLEGNPSFPKEHKVERCDAILLTHGHGDHTGNAVALAKQFAAKVVGIYEVATWLEGQGVASTIGMNKGGTVDLGFLKATMVNAHHSSSGPGNVYLGEAAGYVLEANGRRLYVAGDTCVFGDMRLIAEIHGPLDMAVLPIGDFYTMGPKEASYACRLLRPKVVVPIHWGTFPALTGTPEALASLIHDLPGTKIVALSPGGTIAV